MPTDIFAILLGIHCYSDTVERVYSLPHPSSRTHVPDVKLPCLIGISVRSTLRLHDETALIITTNFIISEIKP